MSSEAPQDFIRQIIADDLANGKHGELVTRFPPEPNGYLHIGHAKSICLNFGVTQQFGGKTYLRFDDTNPTKEDQSFIDAIQQDVRWLGFDWEERLTHASDYFDRLYESAVTLIQAGYAYVDSLSADEIRDYRGTLTEPGKDSPFRSRTVEENLTLFKQMREGVFPDGSHILRAKIDMKSPNINLRDPALYRIKHHSHPITGDKWCIYPMYDFAHGLSDAYEGITHSLCTLEFEDHRPLYDWFLEVLKPENRPRQIEFSRLNLAYTITSKRNLAALIEKGTVDGWDDPRMPTLAGMRRRGYPPEAIRDFCQRIGITKKQNLIEMGSLENSVREALGDTSPRVMGVLDPLKVILTNYPEDKEEFMTAQNHPNDPSMGERLLPFGKTLWIERSDFMEDAPRKFFRLKPDGEVRLRYAYIIKCDKIIKDDAGNVTELHCSFDPDTKSGSATSDKKVKGTIHWVSAKHGCTTPVRVYDRLFKKARPGAGGGNFMDDVNEASLITHENAQLEPSLSEAKVGTTYQFERMGYFTLDRNAESPRFHRVVSLRDSWKKIEAQELAESQD